MVMEHCNRLLREAAESLSLETFKTHLSMILCNLVEVNLLWQSVGLDDLQRSPPAPNILLFKMHLCL